MSKGTLIYLDRFAENLRRELGEEIARQVLAGSEKFNENTSQVKVALWMNGALARLDALVDSSRLAAFFQDCGARCAETNRKGALAARKRRQAAPSIDAFIDAEVIAASSTPFSRMQREGDALAIFYTPYAHQMRCFCPLMRRLPAGQNASAAYCQCSRAFTQRFWEIILEQPVRVEITQSTLMGDPECKFLVRWEG